MFKEWYDDYNRQEEEKTKQSNWNRISQISNVETKILTENLFGVDLDPQAAEIASVNLMLKALKKGQKLPKILGTNIKIGNSLISGTEKKLDKYKIDSASEKVFNWVQEFPDVFENGGFNVVIGNPPYINAIQLSK
ncbi:unnamed protein product, partial [marine sediment metagenome]